MSVLFRVAHVRCSAMVLVHHLDVVDARRPDFPHFSGQRLFGEIARRTEVVPAALPCADPGERQAAVRRQAHLLFQVLFSKGFCSAVVQQVAFLGPSHAAAVDADPPADPVHAVDEGLQGLFSAIGRPDIRRGPRCRSFPVHQQRHDGRTGLFRKRFHERQGVRIRKEFVRRHLVHVVVSADAVGQDDERIEIPVRQRLVIFQLDEAFVVAVEMPAVDIGRCVPVSLEAAQYRFVRCGDRAFFRSGIQLENQPDTVFRLLKIYLAGLPCGVMCSEIQAVAPLYLGQERGTDHARIHGVIAQAGILRFNVCVF